MADAEQAPKILDRGNGFESARNNLAGSGPLGFLGQAGFEQLRVGQDDPELIVEPMKNGREVRNGRDGRSGRNARCAYGLLRRHG